MELWPPFRGWLIPFWVIALLFLDDMVIFSPIWAAHVQHLQTMFQRLQQAGLWVNPGKSKLAFGELKYLGYLVGYGHLWPKEEKIAVLKTLPIPTM